jgi:hypothetical protein
VTTGRNGRLGPADGAEVEPAGARILTKVTAEQTEGRCALIEAHNTPGWESEVNRHPHESKVSYVLEGSYEFFTGGRWGDVCRRSRPAHPPDVTATDELFRNGRQDADVGRSGQARSGFRPPCRDTARASFC